METNPMLDFSPALFALRRSRALTALGRDALVLPAAPVLHRGGDSELPYRPDSDLFYLTGFREPEAILVLRGDLEGGRTVLFVRPRDPTLEQWTGPRMGPDLARELLGISEVRRLEDFESALPALLQGVPRIHYRLGSSARVEAGVMEAMRWGRTRGMRTGSGPRGIQDPGEILHELRLRKDPEEIEAMRQAVQATVAGFQSALAGLAPGVGEWDLEAWLVAGFRRGGGTAPAFSPIVASGPNGCILHSIENQRRVREGDLVLIDAGAEVRMYAADITRTVPASGHFTPPQREVYLWVEEARARAVAAVAPGVPFDRLHRVAVETLAEGLIAMGVLSGSVEGVVETGAYRRYYPHQTSHWLGLDTHDPADYAVEGRSRTLEPGMVLTIEPGLYFPPPGFLGDGGSEAPAVAAFHGIGIRIEDDVRVTSDGFEVLTAALPTDPDRIVEGVGIDVDLLGERGRGR